MILALIRCVGVCRAYSGHKALLIRPSQKKVQDSMYARSLQIVCARPACQIARSFAPKTLARTIAVELLQILRPRISRVGISEGVVSIIAQFQSGRERNAKGQATKSRVEGRSIYTSGPYKRTLLGGRSLVAPSIRPRPTFYRKQADLFSHARPMLCREDPLR